METKMKLVIEEYQCSGCISGSDVSCFEINSAGGIGCGKHFAGTGAIGIGNFFLGMPTGFNRVVNTKH